MSFEILLCFVIQPYSQTSKSYYDGVWVFLLHYKLNLIIEISHKLFVLFCFLVWVLGYEGHAQHCSGIVFGSALRNYCWWCSRVSYGCQGSNPGRLHCKKQTPYPPYPFNLQPLNCFLMEFEHKRRRTFGLTEEILSLYAYSYIYATHTDT